MDDTPCSCGASSAWECGACGVSSSEACQACRAAGQVDESNHADRRPWPSRAELPAHAFVVTFTPAELAALDRLTLFFGLALAGELGRDQAEADAMVSAMRRIRASIDLRERR